MRDSDQSGCPTGPASHSSARTNGACKPSSGTRCSTIRSPGVERWKCRHDRCSAYLTAVSPATQGSARDESRSAPLLRGELRHPRRSSPQDRKSTRLNSSHVAISYAVFCLKKKKEHY